MHSYDRTAASGPYVWITEDLVQVWTTASIWGQIHYVTTELKKAGGALDAWRDKLLRAQTGLGQAGVNFKRIQDITISVNKGAHNEAIVSFHASAAGGSWSEEQQEAIGEVLKGMSFKAAP